MPGKKAEKDKKANVGQVEKVDTVKPAAKTDVSPSAGKATIAATVTQPKSRVPLLAGVGALLIAVAALAADNSQFEGNSGLLIGISSSSQ